MQEFVMAGLDPAIHVFFVEAKTWMPGTRPGMTSFCQMIHAAFEQ
jgi:hypothetical protein